MACSNDPLFLQGRTRRVALTVPTFMFALSVVAETDFLAALPKAFVTRFAPRFGVASVPAPLPLDRSRIQAIASKAGLADARVAWLFERLTQATAT